MRLLYPHTRSVIRCIVENDFDRCQNYHRYQIRIGNDRIKLGINNSKQSIKIRAVLWTVLMGSPVR